MFQHVINFVSKIRSGIFPVLVLSGMVFGSLVPSLAVAEAGVPSDRWKVTFYGGHFGVKSARKPHDRRAEGPVRDGVGTPVKYGEGYSAVSPSYSFDDVHILNTSSARTENPSYILEGTLETYTHLNGGYPDTNGEGSYSFIFKRRAPGTGRIRIGEVGGYFDDFAEVFVNGALVASIDEWTSPWNFPNGLTEDDVIDLPVNGGDLIELRFTNGRSLGGFKFSAVFEAWILAGDDDLGVFPFGAADSGSASILEDNGSGPDLLHGAAANTGIASLNVLKPAVGIGGSNIVPMLDVRTGQVAIPGMTPAGRYNITYELCSVAEPTACDSAVATLRVVKEAELLTARASVGLPLVLDPTDGFEAQPGATLRAKWSWISRPATSVVDFDNTAVLRPTVTPDVAGTYLAELTLFDRADTLSSEPLHKVRIVFGTGNLPPVSRIAGRGVPGGTAITLDGGDSHDVNGDVLHYAWHLERKPDASQAVLSGSNSPLSTLTPDVDGLYVIGLKVSDDKGEESQTALYAVRQTDGQRQVAPVASAGFDQVVAPVDSPFVLDSWNSSDIDADPLTANAGFIVAPSGSSVSEQALPAGRADVTPDTTGDYLVSLAVTDGQSNAYDQILVTSDSSSNLRPVARIAPVYSAVPGSGIAFDGTQSFDLNGDLLSYEWALLHAPTGSAAALSDVQTLYASLAPDVDGQYVVQLQVSDGTAVSQPKTLLVQVGATLPVGDAGYDLHVASPGQVTLDGGASVGGSLNYAWSRTGLSGEVTGTLTGADLAIPTLTLDSADDASVLQLIVSNVNGAARPDTVVVGNVNLRPALRPGSKIEIAAGQSIDLNAASYARDANGDALSFGWSLIYRPDGSAAALTSPIVAGDTLVFAPDRTGTYLVQLAASDSEVIAQPAVIRVEVVNSPPVAAVSGDAEAFVGDVATISAAGSADPDGDALSYAWTLVSAPDGSAAALAGQGQPVITFTPDRRGQYVFSLVVSDYEFGSAPVTWTLTAPNRAPVALLEGPDQVDVEQEVTYSAAGSDDPDNDPLTYSYAVSTKPAGSDPVFEDSGNGQAEFVADLPGDYVLEVTVSDGLLEATHTLAVSASALNAAPVLGQLRDVYTVELGLELALDLEGSDPDGDPISFFATPLPLANGVTLDGNNGQVRFRPETGQLGTYTYTVGVSDGVLTDEATLTIEVVEATAGDTAIHGRVLDATDFAAGTITPLANMPVRLRDAALMTTTAADGTFSFGSLVAGTDQVEVEPSADGGPGGYLGEIRAVTVTGNQNRDISPDFLLVPLTDGCATVVAGQETVLSGVTVSIPADSVQVDGGGIYTGKVCLGSLPRLFEHPGFNEDIRACRIYALDAPGAVFTRGMTITGPNLDNLPEQTRLEMWRVSRLNGLFRRAGDASVDTGAGTVSGTLSGISDSALFTFLPQAPQTVASADQPTGMKYLTPFEGDNATSYTLPGYTAFGEAQEIALSYHSQAANPTIIVAGDVTIADDASLPKALQTRIEAGGLSISDGRSWTPRERLDGYAPALIGEQVTLRQSMPVDGSGLTSGRYAYKFNSKAMYDCSTVGGTHMAEFYVQNESTSSYGNGWAIDDLQKLVEGPDGKISIIDDDGITTFDPEPTLTEFEDEPLVFPAIGGDPGIAAADLDNDGDLDVVFGESGRGTISTIINYGDGDLRQENSLQVTSPNNVPQTGNYPPNLAALALGELDNNAGVDVAYVLSSGRGFGYVTNDGFGDLIDTFQDTGINGNALDIDVLDIDQDGYEDIVYSVQVGSLFNFIDEIWVSYGGPNGRTLNRISRRNFGRTPLQVMVGDIDGNGYQDVAYRTRSGVDFVFNNGNRSYTLRDLRVGNGGINLLGEYAQLGDFDNDGKLDIFYSTPTELQIVRNTTGQAFAAPVTLARPAGADTALSVSVGDANGDEIPDLITASGGQVFVYNGNGDGTFQPFESGLVDYGFAKIDFADINGDGSLDLLSTQRFSVRVHFSKPSATGNFVANDGEFSTLERLADGTWQRRYKDGNIVLYDANGLQTAAVDPQGNRKEYTYDDNGRLATITDQVGGITSFAYEDIGRLASITYPDGRVTSFAYDDIGNLNEVTEPVGSRVSFAYDANGRLVSTTNQNGNVTRYTYDGMGNLKGATLPDGSSVANQVASSLGLVDGLGGAATSPLIYVAPEDRVTTVIDRKGQTTEVIVNQFGSVIQTTDPLGRVTKIERDDQNLAVRVERPSETTPGGVRVDTITYDSLGNVETMTESVGTPAERTTSYTYEPTYNKVLTMTDGDGFTTSYEYDGFGKVAKITDAEGGARIQTYTTEGKLATRTDENGNVTSFTYTADQNLASTTHADGSITQITYDTAGNTTVIAEAAGSPIERQVRRSYDGLNRVLSVEVTGADGANIGGVTQYTYLPAGNLETVTDQTGLVTTMTYDGLERLVAIDDPAEGLIQRVYNEAGEVVEHTNGDGETHLYAYDDVSRLIRTTDPEGHVKSFTYDNRDNIATVTDGRAGVTSFAYDTLDRMVSRTNPISQTMTRAYDSRGNLTMLTREDGLVETASYDGLSRRTQVVTPDNTLTYGYDPRSNLTLATDKDSRVTFTYDTRNRVATTTTDGTVGPQPQITLTYSYDLLDRRTGMEDSLGGVTSYAWDAEDRLIRLTSPWGSTYSFGYDDEGRRTALTSTSGRATTYAYTNGLLSALTHAQSGVKLTDLGYTYDPDGQLTAILDRLDPAQSRHISYDDLNRLVQVRQGIPLIDGGVPVPIEDYAYDAEGNRTFSDISSGYESNAHNQLLEDDTYRYAYDLRGNRISRTHKVTGAVETYTYDSQNRLIGYGSDTTTAAYAYDALDRRIAKTVGTDVEAFVYDPWDPYATTANDAVLDFENGTLAKRWLHGPRTDEPLAFEGYTGSTDAGSGSAYGLFANRLGSILTAVSVSTGAVAADYDYDAFGNQTQTVNTIEQRYGYTGRERDYETGLIYYRARHYDPAIGQFIQRDPIGFAAGDLNLYAYTWNNPYNYRDASGLTGSLTLPGKVAKNRAKTAAVVGAVSQGVGALAANIRNALLAVRIANVVANSSNTDDVAKKASESSDGDNSGCDANDPNCEDQCKSANGNSKDSTNAQHAYDIVDTKTGKVVKTGISGGKINKNGLSQRAQRQVRAWNREVGNANRYRSEVTWQHPGGQGARQDALAYERTRADNLRRDGHLKDPKRHKCP